MKKSKIKKQSPKHNKYTNRRRRTKQDHTMVKSYHQARGIVGWLLQQAFIGR